MAADIVLLVVLAVLGWWGKNPLVFNAAWILLLVELAGFRSRLGELARWSLGTGLVLLMIGAVVPLLGGTTVSELWSAIRSPRGFLAVAFGIAATLLGSRGVPALQTYPEIASGLVIGSLVGAAFLRGVPTGPLIAAGATALLSDLLRMGR